MIKNKHFLKTILTTASTVAIAIGVASEAGAAVRTIAGVSTALTADGTGIAGFTSGDPITVHAADDNITITSIPGSNPKILAGVNLNGFVSTGTLTASTSMILGAIGNGTGMTLKVTNGIA